MEFGKYLNQVPEGMEVHQAAALTDRDLAPADSLDDQQLNKRPELVNRWLSRSDGRQLCRKVARVRHITCDNPLGGDGTMSPAVVTAGPIRK